MNCFFLRTDPGFPEIERGSASGDDHDKCQEIVTIAGTYGRLSQKPRAGLPLT
jgi:hypothetical protein